MTLTSGHSSDVTNIRVFARWREHICIFARFARRAIIIVVNELECIILTMKYNIIYTANVMKVFLLALLILQKL